MINEHFDIVSGRFKIPLMRGEQGVSIENYQSIESIMGNNLDSWLCNMYLEVRHFPLHMLEKESNQRTSEYDIEFNFINKILNMNLANKKLPKESSVTANGPDDDATYINTVVGRTDTGLFHRKLAKVSKKSPVESNASTHSEELNVDGIGFNILYN